MYVAVGNVCTAAGRNTEPGKWSSDIDGRRRGTRRDFQYRIKVFDPRFYNQNRQQKVTQSYRAVFAPVAKSRKAGYKPNLNPRPASNLRRFRRCRGKTK